MMGSYIAQLACSTMQYLEPRLPQFRDVQPATPPSQAQAHRLIVAASLRVCIDVKLQTTDTCAWSRAGKH